VSSASLCSFLLFFATAPTFGQGIITQPFPGVTFVQEVKTNPPLRDYYVQADMSNPAIHLRVAPAGPNTAGPPWQTTLMTVSKIAARDHLDVAVNGSFFAPKDALAIFGRKLPYFEGNPAQATGWTVSDGRLWTEHPLSLDFPSLVLMRDGRLFIDHLSTPPRDALQVVSGCEWLVRQGRSVGPPGDDPAPRTAVGLDEAGKILTLFVVDGRRSSSQGLSNQQTGDEMLKLGCYSAICLDSGGSSTLVIRNGQKWPVINTPSDGHDLFIPLSIERPVADALGITVDAKK
jgi:hypothetical protein